MTYFNKNGSRVLRGVFFAVLFAVSGLASCGGGEGSASVIPGAGLIVSVAPSRASGVAPLAVFFDATQTTSSSLTAYPTQPFHDISYTWNFGDSAGSPAPSGTVTTWSTGSQSATASCSPTPLPGCRNYATGAITAHVYENTGTFYPSVTMYDGTNTQTYNLPAITVTAFSGTTYCYYSSTAYGSCPNSGTEHATSGDFVSDIGNALTAGARQILFKRGDTFISTSTKIIGTAGPGIIGSYGSNASAVPTLTTSASSGVVLSFNSTATDWRAMDLSLTDSTSANTTDGVASGSKITLLRVSASNLLYDFIGTPSSTYAVIQDSTFGSSSVGAGATYGVYNVGRYIAILGNSINVNNSGSHDIRLQGDNYFVIANNTLIGGIGSTGYEGFLVHGNSQYGEISDNTVTLMGGDINPQFSGVSPTEYQHDIIVERNFFLGAGLGLNSSYITVRNNIFNPTSSLAGGSPNGVGISWSGTAPQSPEPSGNEIYNNSIYVSLSGSANGVSVGQNYAMDTGCTLAMKNNLVYFPNITSPLMLSNTGTCVINRQASYIDATYGNSSNSQIKSTSPNWTNGSGGYTLPTDFKPNTGSYAIGAGVIIPVYQDFFGNTRSGFYDMGAVNH